MGLVENDFQEVFPGFELIVLKTERMGEKEAFVEWNPPRLTISELAYVEAYNNVGRRRFTLAHEAGHLRLHGRSNLVLPRTTEIPTKRTSWLLRAERYEHEANYFAACFLIPRHLAKGFTNPFEASSAFNVSVEVARRRLENLGQMSKSKIVSIGFRKLLDEMNTKPLRAKVQFVPDQSATLASTWQSTTTRLRSDKWFHEWGWRG